MNTGMAGLDFSGSPDDKNPTGSTLYIETGDRTCPYSVPSGITTTIHMGDDGAGGPVRWWSQ